MAVSESYAAQDFDGAASGVPLAVTFEVQAITDIFMAYLLIGGTEFVNLTVDVDFTRQDLGGGAFSVTPLATYATGVTVRVFRMMDYTQPYTFDPLGPLPADQVGAMADRLCMLIQNLRLESGLDVATVTLPPGATLVKPTTTFANSTARGNAIPSFVGQLGVQTNTQALYEGTALTAGAWTLVSTGGSGGDVVGPASSLALAIPFYADTTGKILGTGAGTNPATSPTIDAGTMTNTTPRPLTVVQTWQNAAGTFTALRVSVTDTNSAAASLLMDLQVGGVSKFNVRKDGVPSAKSYDVSATGYVGALTGAILRFVADAILNISNNAETIGVRIDVSVADTFRVRKLDNSADGGVKTGTFTATITFTGPAYAVDATGYIGWTGRTVFRSAANGRLTVTNSGENSGGQIDASVLNIFKFHKLDNSGDAAIEAGQITASLPVVVPSYTVAQLLAATPNPATYPRGVVYCSDGTANKRMAISDGSNWRFPDGNIVS